MENIKGDFCILNGNLEEISAYKPEISASIYYEVLRVLKGKALFINDHLQRLISSTQKVGLKHLDIEEVRKHIETLIHKLQLNDGNIKVVVFSQNDILNICSFQIPHFYPSANDYKNGVATMSYLFERPNPTIKRWNDSFRSSVNLFIRNEKIYEALLVNEEGRLTEGSRSNLFFIDTENNIITAPENIILPGITRKYILQICKENKIPILEKTIDLQEAKEMKACFITGTSPMVLPVRRIDQIEYDVNLKVLQHLISEYNSIIKNHLND